VVSGLHPPQRPGRARRIANPSRVDDLPRIRTVSPTHASTPVPKAGAQCVSSARWDLRGGPPARAVPTAIPHPALLRPRPPHQPGDLQPPRPHRRPNQLQQRHQPVPRINLNETQSPNLITWHQVVGTFTTPRTAESEKFWGRPDTSMVDLRIGTGRLGQDRSRVMLIHGSSIAALVFGRRYGSPAQHCLPQNVSLSS
jgi:hypothetical protein